MNHDGVQFQLACNCILVTQTTMQGPNPDLRDINDKIRSCFTKRTIPRDWFSKTGPKNM